jgi:trehalose 6-phosphate synthase
MSKLIVVTNREPFILRRTATGLTADRQTAGLLGALEPVLLACSGTWISWSGFEREAPRIPKSEGLPEKLDVNVGAQTWSLRRLPLSEREASLYHYGWACRTQWPLMHLMLGRGAFDPEAWRAFKRVSQRFCDAVLEAYQPGDRIWIHEHNLALLPALLRAAIPGAAIAYSWNIPWPPVEALAAMPWAGELVAGVLGADRIGVALPRYGKNLVAAAEALCGARTSNGLAGGSHGSDASGEHEVTIGGHTAHVGPLPLGCDVERWAARSRAARGARSVRLKRNLGADRLALAVDRVDLTRGIAERLRAVERFFDRYPSWRGRLVVCQVAVPSRTRVEEYRDMKKEIDGLVERINARFGQDGWLPVRYLYKVLDADDLAAHYVAADVLLATPLSDGLGFVPLEYVAARTHGDGTLILSSLGGTAELIPEAVRVNPYDEEGVASTLHAALEARPGEIEARMRAVRERVEAHDLHRGLETFWQTAFGEPFPGEPVLPLPQQVTQPTYASAPDVQ